MAVTQAPRLETERLILKHFTPDDFADLFACWSAPEMIKINRGQPPTSEDIWGRLLRYIGHWQALGYGYWAIFEKATDRYVGSLGFQDARREITPPLPWPEAGWTLIAGARGKGYAQEALAEILRWADQHFTSPVCCIIDGENLRSVSLAERFGFRFREEVAYRNKKVRLLVRG